MSLCALMTMIGEIDLPILFAKTISLFLIGNYCFITFLSNFDFHRAFMSQLYGLRLKVAANAVAANVAAKLLAAIRTLVNPFLGPYPK